MRVRTTVLAATAGFALVPILAAEATAQDDGAVQLGPRPYYLVNDMDKSELKATLEACDAAPFKRTDFSIGHRGAALMFPEHTRESYVAAARMGAGIVECDVTFTKDRELVCRHAQCDLHTTTNILARPELAAKCTEPFTPADPQAGTEASAKCCTSDITLAEFKTLEGKMDAYDPAATTDEAYMGGTAPWRTDLYSPGTLMTHAESIELFKDLGVKFIPELKAPEVEMPYEGEYSQEDYAQALVDAYEAAGVDPANVYAQSFNLDDVRYWIENTPEFGAQAVYLDERYDAAPGFDPTGPATWSPTMEELVADGVKIVAPPLWVLVTLDDAKQIVPSPYAEAAKAAGLDIITWTLERSGPLDEGGGWYYQSVSDAIDNDGDMLTLLDVLAKDVGVLGVFSDWPATVTYYANCTGLE
jgi:glycerophosphoryl diester phosphodiesterase